MTETSEQNIGSTAAQQQERRRQLIAYLEHLNKTEPERFSLSRWIAAYTAEELAEAVASWQDRHQRGELLNCGAAACVVGHLPVAFPERFRWELSPAHREEGSVVDKIEGEFVRCHHLKAFFGGGEDDWSRVIYQSEYSKEDRGGSHTVPLSAVIRRIKDLDELLLECEKYS